MKQNYETLDELAERTRLPKSWFYRRSMMKDPDGLPFLKIGKYLRFEPEKVDAWLKKQGKK